MTTLGHRILRPQEFLALVVIRGLCDSQLGDHAHRAPIIGSCDSPPYFSDKYADSNEGLLWLAGILLQFELVHPRTSERQERQTMLMLRVSWVVEEREASSGR